MLRTLDCSKSKYLYLFSFFIGSLSAASFAPLYIIPFILLSYIFLIFLLESTTNFINAWKIGFCFSFGQIFFSLYWISVAFVKGEVGGLALGVPAVLAISFILSLFGGLTCICIKFLHNQNYSKISLVILYSTVFVLFDWLKGNLLGGFPWTPISSIWTFSVLTLKPLSLIGTWGYSYVTFLGIIGFYLINKSIKIFFISILPFLSLLICTVFFNESKNLVDRNISVRLVQPNILQVDKWDESKLKKNLEVLFKLSNSDQNNFGKFDIIIWPETSIPFLIKNEENLSKLIENKIHVGKYLILGAIRLLENSLEDKKIYNSLFVVKSDGDIIGSYDKVTLVPFGEYVPLRNILPLNKITQGMQDFESGNKIQTIKIDNSIKFSPLICYEVIFSGKVIDNANRPDVIINITNDAWYGYTSGPFQHFALSRMRAAEEGIPLIRVANTGISAIIGPYGEIIKKLSINQKGVIDFYFPISLEKTLFSELGNLIFWYLIGLGILLAFVFRKTKN